VPSKPLTEAEISTKLYLGNSFRVGDRTVRVMFLLPDSLRRPLKAHWWTRKEASILGGDESGNYILRLSDGSVQLWDHLAQDTVPLASSIRAFVDGLKPEGPQSAA
jgi:hypothetical protein